MSPVKTVELWGGWSRRLNPRKNCLLIRSPVTGLVYFGAHPVCGKPLWFCFVSDQTRTVSVLNEDTPPFLLSCYRVPGNLTLSRWAALVPQPVHSEETIGTHLKMLGLAT